MTALSFSAGLSHRLCSSGLNSSGIPNSSDFLNCLHGSEQALRKRRRAAGFLNCLCSSEHLPCRAWWPVYFLNCLCGSEQVNKTAVNRFDRIHPFYFLFYQSFIFFYSYQSLWAFPDFYHQIGYRLPLIHAKKLPEITRAGTESASGESRKFFYEVFSRLTGKRS